MVWLILPRIGFGAPSVAADVLRNEGVTSISIVEGCAMFFCQAETVPFAVAEALLCRLPIPLLLSALLIGDSAGRDG